MPSVAGAGNPIGGAGNSIWNSASNAKQLFYHAALRPQVVAPFCRSGYETTRLIVGITLSDRFAAPGTDGAACMLGMLRKGSACAHNHHKERGNWVVQRTEAPDGNSRRKRGKGSARHKASAAARNHRSKLVAGSNGPLHAKVRTGCAASRSKRQRRSHIAAAPIETQGHRPLIDKSDICLTRASSLRRQN